MNQFSTGQQVRFTYHGTVREGTIERVGNTYITIFQGVSNGKEVNKSYSFNKMSNVTIWPYGWQTL